jgi:hypothetical protein
LLPPERIFVCTGAAHGRAVLENLPELPKENLLGEPEGRDTANAVGFPRRSSPSATRTPWPLRHRRSRHRADRHVPGVDPTAFDVVAEHPTRWSPSASSRRTATRASATSIAAKRCR